MEAETIKKNVRERYARTAVQGGCCGGTSCEEVIPFEDIQPADQVIQEANLGLGCGFPTAYADLQLGETVLDLGSGAGVDVFIAAKTVGSEGTVIGVDMTPEMIARARQNAQKGGYHNVDFRLGDIENLPVEDDSVDVILSNCVINLAPDKGRVFAEMYRVLKPGGRFSISDVVTRGQVPQEIRQDAEKWAACMGGALDQETYLGLLRAAGFADLKVNQAQESDDQTGVEYAFISLTVEGYKRDGQCC
jgi:arsenite methyltransferase